MTGINQFISAIAVTSLACLVALPQTGSAGGRGWGPYFKYQYTAKFVCGTVEATDDPTQVVRALPGIYASAINVLNPDCNEVTIRKKVALTFPPGGQTPGMVSDWFDDSLGPYEAIEVDCGEIPQAFFSGGVDGSFAKGFLIIESSRTLDVTSVHTAGVPEFSGDITQPVIVVRSIDVERVPKRRIYYYWRHDSPRP